MKLGIMQPYFMPYLGYWQLINAVDKYIIYDDVNYIKGGWINRNRILSNGGAVYFNLPVIGASPNKLINEVEINLSIKGIKKSLKTLVGCYQKAPYFSVVFPLLESIMYYKEANLALFIKHSFETIAGYLNINTEFILSSKLEKNNELKAQDKVIHICELVMADEYFNAIGGQQLYSYEDFNNRGIKLSFVKTRLEIYKQFKNDFIPGLSIIDILMFNSRDECIKQLNNFELLGEQL
ncbi:MAG: WbqC family protein [Erysipelotrichaceae bacterium]